MKRFRALIHILGWLFFLSLPAIFILAGPGDRDFDLLLEHPVYWLGFLVYIFIFYLNTDILFPRLFLRKKYIAYFISVTLLFLLVFFLRPFDNLIAMKRMVPATQRNEQTSNGISTTPGQALPEINRPHGRPAFDIISIALFFLVMAVSIALVIEKRWRIAVEQAARAETDKVNAELSFLKAQVNPHFLFNTLNNIYSLAVSKSDNTADAIMKLSNIMRYVTDEVNEKQVPLQSEIDCMSDYISLQYLRLGKKASIDFSVSGDPSGKQIAPLILMTFIENAFKHGISNHEAANISIWVTADEKQIHFFTQNKLFTKPRNTDRTGIGITNAKKRLYSIYQDKYFLDISEANGLFTVRLILQGLESKQ